MNKAAGCLISQTQYTKDLPPLVWSQVVDREHPRTNLDHCTAVRSFELDAVWACFDKRRR